jgi:hypothetical protein
MIASRRLSKDKSGGSHGRRWFVAGRRMTKRLPPDDTICILSARNIAVPFRPKAEEGDAAVWDAATRPAGTPKDHAV